MRITFVCPPSDLSGGQRVIAIYAQRLRQRGHHVIVVSPSRRKPTIRQVLRSLYRFRCWPKRVMGFLDGLDVERRVLDRYRPVSEADVPDADVVIATWWETAEWVMSLPPSKGAKVYFVQHHEVFEHLPVERARATYRLPMQKIVVARWLADVVRDVYGDGGARVVPNAVSHNQFQAPPRSKNRVPTVGLIYSTIPFKGCDIALEAFRCAAIQCPELRLMAFGNSEADSRLPLPAGAEYYVAPSQDQIPALYAACDAWLFASRSEGFGLPILEAMACRTPVIGTPTGAAPELLGAGGGWLIPPEDPKAMAEAIVRLCRLPEAEWCVLSEAAHAVASRYTWDDAVNLFEDELVAVNSRCS